MPQYGIDVQHSNLGGLINAIASAANQQAAVKRQQDAATAAQAQQSLKDQMEAYAAGGVDAPLSTQNQQPVAPGRPTLMSGDYQPDTDGSGTNPGQTPYTMVPSRTLNVGGKQINFPTKAQKEQLDLNDSNSFVAAPGSDTEKFLQQTTNTPPGTRIPFAHVGAVGTLADQMQRASDAAAKKKQTAVVTKDASDKAKALGLDIPEGSEVPFGQLNEFMQALQPKEKTPKSLHFETDTGANLVRGYDPETGAQVSTAPGAGMTAAQTEAAKDRKVTQARLAEDTATRLSAGDQKKADTAAKAQALVQQKHDDFRSQEKDQWNLKGFYDKLIDPSQTPDNATVTLPSYNARTGEINEGSTRVMNPDLRGSLTRLSKQAADKAMENQDSARKIRKSMGWGEFAPPAQTSSPAPSQPAPQRATAPAVQTAPPGVTEGTIIVNKQTKQRQMWKGGKWTPAPSLQ